jgi:hypothetical protein
MKSFTFVSLTVAVATLILGSVIPVAAGNPVVHSARGAGQTMLTTGWRTFALTAEQREDGTVTGQLQLFNRDSGVLGHIEILDMHVQDNHAALVGMVTGSHSPLWEVGMIITVGVVDQGEGAEVPDEITLVWYYFDLNIDPYGWVLPDFEYGTFIAPDPWYSLLPVEAGNIQVR